MAAQRSLSRLRVTLAILLLFLGAVEVGLRAARFEYPPDAERVVLWSRAQDHAMRAGDALHEIDAHEIWRPRVGARIPWTKDEHINAAGMRGPIVPLERQPGVLRIAVIGGTASFGYGVGWSETYSASLVRCLGERGVRAEVLCAAVMDSTIRQGLERYRRRLRPYKPDVVIASYSGHSEHLQAPGSCSDASRIETGCGMLASITGAPLEPASWLRRRSRVVHAGAWLRDLYWGSYWKEREAELAELRLVMNVNTFDVAVIRRVAITEFQDCIAMLSKEVRADAASLILLSIPRSQDESGESHVLDTYTHALFDSAQHESVRVINGRAVYAQAADSGLAIGNLFLGDHFPSKCAHGLLAQALADEILARLPEFLR